MTSGKEGTLCIAESTIQFWLEHGEKLLLLLVQPTGIKISAQLWLRWHFLFLCFLFLSLFTNGIWVFSFTLGRELEYGKTLVLRGRVSHFLSPVLLCVSPIPFATPFTLSLLLFLSPWGFSCQSPSSFFILESLSRKWNAWWDGWGFPLWGVLVVPDLTLPGSGSQGTEGEKRRDCSCKWVPGAWVCLHSKVKVIWTGAALAAC